MISAITPTYNCSEFIRRSYNALCSQTFTDWEWIVVNDGSTDNTDEIFSEIILNDSRVKYFPLEKNKGRGFARNFAVNQCKGSIIAIWDVDDLYTPDRFAEINQVLSNSEDFFYFCSHALIVDNEKNFKGARHCSNNSKGITPNFVHPTLAFKNRMGNLPNYPINKRAGEDLELMLFLKQNHKGFYCNKYLLIYFEDREVNIGKAFTANYNQFKSIISLINARKIYLPIFFRYKFYISRILKLAILSSFFIYPSLYLKTVHFREYNLIRSKLLNCDHLKTLNNSTTVGESNVWK